jgi:hypothetical protein
MLTTRYQCSAEQAAKAYFVCIFVGTLLTTLALLIINIAVGPEARIVGSVLSLPFLVLFYGPIVAGMFSLPGLVLSVPIFLLLHTLRLRDWPFLTLAGAILEFVAGYRFLAFLDRLLDGPQLATIEHATLLGVIGGLTGFVMWSIAYAHIDLRKFRRPIIILGGVLAVGFFLADLMYEPPTLNVHVLCRTGQPCLRW